MDPNRQKILKEFVKFVIKELGLGNTGAQIILSNKNEDAKKFRSFGGFTPDTKEIWIYIGNRNLADILRTLAHELVHQKQNQDGRINYESGETGSEIENEANSMAGVLLRDYGKLNVEIYE